MDMNANGKYVVAVAALYILFGFELVYILVVFCRKYRDPSGEKEIRAGRGRKGKYRDSSWNSGKTREMRMNYRRKSVVTNKVPSGRYTSTPFTLSEEKITYYRRGVDTFINSGWKRGPSSPRNPSSFEDPRLIDLIRDYNSGKPWTIESNTKKQQDSLDECESTSEDVRGNLFLGARKKSAKGKGYTAAWINKR